MYHTMTWQAYRRRQVVAPRPLALVMVAALLIAGCDLGARQAPGLPLPSILVASEAPSPEGSTHYGKLNISALNPGDGSMRWRYQTDWHP